MVLINVLTIENVHEMPVLVSLFSALCTLLLSRQLATLLLFGTGSDVMALGYRKSQIQVLNTAFVPKRGGGKREGEREKERNK